jgi:hypothetical protein
LTLFSWQMCSERRVGAWLFYNTTRKARASVIIYSIVETVKENGLNLYDYLTYLFRSLPNVDVKNPDAVRQLLSWNVDLPKKSLRLSLNCRSPDVVILRRLRRYATL